MRRRAFRLIVTAVSLVAVPSARAEITDCQEIPSAPWTIHYAGTYCLKKDLWYGASVGAAITIAAPYVVLDLNGHRIDGPTDPGVKTIGILIENKMATVRNGTIRRFLYGVKALVPSSGSQIEDLLLDANLYIGIYSEGTGVVVRRNRVTNTGGSTFLPGSALGIYVMFTGSGTQVIANEVSNTGSATQHGVGIRSDPLSSHTVLIEGNRVVNNQAWPNGSIGIVSQKGMVVDNRVFNAVSGILGKDSALRDNLVLGCATPYEFAPGMDLGNNN